jgi:hypothetical protein
MADPPSGDFDRVVAEATGAPGRESLLDLVDNLLNQGVVVSGDVMLGLADVDLIYLRVSVILCAADRVLPASGKT